MKKTIIFIIIFLIAISDGVEGKEINRTHNYRKVVSNKNEFSHSEKKLFSQKLKLMTLKEALKNLDKKCPERIIKDLRLVRVKFYDFNGETKEGELLIHRRLVSDVKKIFDFIYKIKFPLRSVIPVSHPYFNWNDEKSMEFNNTSAFNYRKVKGTNRLSKHSFGYAIDINPKLNPWITKRGNFPVGSKYNPKIRGTLSINSKVVKKFIELGWTWGGFWKNQPDYQHFQKIP